MGSIVAYLWLIPVLPLAAAGVTALLKQPRRSLASGLAIGSMVVSFLLSCAAFFATLHPPADGQVFRAFHNFDWFQLGEGMFRLGWVLDPLSACMLVMVTFVGSLIFIYSAGYMARDVNYTRFFCFLSLFAAAMLGLLIANSLLLFFICWELVGLASYLLIGFWYHKPSAAAAAKKAFITTRIGDIGLFLGMLWLYSETGTLLFYDDGNGCLEKSALANLTAQVTAGGLAVSTAISLLIFCGPIGKSGQVPLHVWLPDAMEGPTPVSALIHAATMVAAGVFLVARVFPLMAGQAGEAVGAHAAHSPALSVVTWVGAITAVFAACIAVAQTDIKRILAYSTVSQLGFMFMGLGVGGVAVGMFHLLTHAFFKALLFLGAGSVIHGCHEEQDIRRLGGLRKHMPATFATYAIGMMALAGVPLLFSGFWSKDEILHSASHWAPSQGPFLLGALGALLTAFYMTRQMCYVFLGDYRGTPSGGHAGHEHPASDSHHRHDHASDPHESPAIMTVPLKILAFFAIVLGFVGTPVWPWFESYLNGHHAPFGFSRLGAALPVMLLSTLIVAAGMGLGWKLYGRRPSTDPEALDPLQRLQPTLFAALRDRLYVDELYELTIIAWHQSVAKLSHWFDLIVIDGLVKFTGYLALGVAWLNRFMDEYVVNFGFDRGCDAVRGPAGWLSRLQNGDAQGYLRVIGAGLVVLLLLLAWGGRS